MSTPYSYSRIDTYQQCGFRFYLKYILGNDSSGGSIATEVGTLIHETEEAIARCIQNKESINYTELKNKIILKQWELKYKYGPAYDKPDKSDRTYNQKLYDYLKTGIYKLEQYMQNHPTYEIVGVEQEFLITIAEHEFRGFIDRVFHDIATDTYIVQDIKTYAVPMESAKLTTPLQFVVYTEAAKNLWGCNYDQVICQYYLPFCDLTQAAGTKNYMIRGTKKLTELFAGIAAEDFEAKPTALCHWCDFASSNPNALEENKYLCPYFCHWTRENKVFTRENDWTGLENYPILLEQFKQKHQINIV